MAQRRESLPLLGIQLENGVEIHDLDACGGIQLLPRNGFVHLFRDAVGVGVAVGTGISEQGTVIGHETEIHAPGIDADGIRPDTFLLQPVQTLDEMLVDGQDVPVVLSAQADNAAGETLHFFHLKAAGLESGQHSAPAGGAAVKSKESPNHNPTKIPFYFIR